MAGSSQREQPIIVYYPNFNRYLARILFSSRTQATARGEYHDWAGSPQDLEALGQAHAALNASSLFRFEVVPGGHEYFVQPTIPFLKQYL
jgi:hypothetical protein